VTDPSHDSYSSPRRRSGSHPRKRHADGPLNTNVLLAIMAVLGIMVILMGVDAFSSAGRVHPGVTVGGVAVGGKTPTEAMQILKTELPKKAAVPITVSQGAKSWTIKASDIDATFEYRRLLEAAMAIGRSSTVGTSLGQRFHSWFGGTAISAIATADAGKLDATIGKIAAEIDVEPKDATLKVSADGVTTKPSATGVAVDREKLKRDLLATFAADQRVVQARAAVSQPRIDDEAAKSAREVVDTMISAEATMVYRSKSWKLSQAELAKMITFQQAEDSSTQRWSLVPMIGTKEASKTIVPRIGSALGTPPKDARFHTSGGAVEIVPSRDGVGPDVAQFAVTLTEVLKNPGRDRTVALQTTITPPKLTTEKARAMGVRERISTFTTEYSSGNASRVNNIHVLGDALDGKLIAPGDTFSFNGAVGERTAAKGYQEANAIVKGKLVPQLGGGICQVATTMFNAVFFSGLPVTERTNHSFYISHYPMGRDATVSWGGPDLRWKNTTDGYVLVSVSYTSDSITVSLYGTDPGYDVSYSTVPFSDNVPFKTVKVKDPTLPVGTSKVMEPGENGGKAVVTRTVKRGSTVVRTDTFTSTYTPVSETVNVGTKVVKPKTTTPTTTKKP
jgi:vancomycin resistance protein YoaR